MFLLLLIISDMFIGFFLGFLYFYPDLKAQNEISYAFNNSKEQIIIYGSSTANNHFNPKIIAAKTNCSCYNAGQGGQSILYFQALNRSILMRYNPEIIILNLDWTIFDYQSSEKLGVLLPYYYNHPEIRDILRSRSNLERLKLLSSTYPFNSEIYMIFRQLLGTHRDTIKNGYYPEIGEFELDTNRIKQDLKKDYSINPLKLIAYDELVNFCKMRNINLIFTITPVYDTTLVERKLFEFADSIARINEVPIFNYSTDKRFYKNGELFIDNIHMNSDGADLFSQIFADNINKIINSPTYLKPVLITKNKLK
jgi:hypothetical protein